ncbi:hypothetical protein OGATHE_001027, partial [Ogataea polymorpha]
DDSSSLVSDWSSILELPNKSFNRSVSLPFTSDSSDPGFSIFSKLSSEFPNSELVD